MLVGSSARCWLLLVCLAVLCAAALAENVTIQSTASEIAYSPPACNTTAASCESAWYVAISPDDPTALVTSTSGPTNGSAALVPQLFLTFTGTALYIRTSNASTAVVNVSLATHNPDFAITATVDTAETANGLITVVGLPSDRPTTLTMMFVPSLTATTLDVSNITIVTTGNECVSVFHLLVCSGLNALWSRSSPFSSSPLPSSTAIPTFSPVVSPATSSQASSKQTHDDIIAEVLGAVLGVVVCLFAAVGLLFWKKRRRKQVYPPQTPGD
ncbi:uncharacterized protein B0H18DRAFT_873108 [Fomitopsis serialis]|uniref:uncharacterized protein n=1 Tax=Fomitopsis serialis TaxID=139415 RepID=UPI002008E318|nr:uncharacterized protein B0H18DRAFT_873108 [Neoantrodia serialis]KAH9930243.1 hypothetical protein B0H18DRAFT_873108 [Neoantrodia serialis]